MQFVIQGVGIALMLMSPLFLAIPAQLLAVVPNIIKGKNLYLVAALRVGLGCILLVVAASARHPLAIEIVGWLAVLAGLMMLVIPPEGLRAVVGWAQSWPIFVIRLLAPMVFSAGAYLVWVFL